MQRWQVAVQKSVVASALVMAAAASVLELRRSDGAGAGAGRGGGVRASRVAQGVILAAHTARVEGGVDGRRGAPGSPGLARPAPCGTPAPPADAPDPMPPSAATAPGDAFEEMIGQLQGSLEADDFEGVAAGLRGPLVACLRADAPSAQVALARACDPNAAPEVRALLFEGLARCGRAEAEAGVAGVADAVALPADVRWQATEALGYAPAAGTATVATLVRLAGSGRDPAVAAVRALGVLAERAPDPGTRAPLVAALIDAAARPESEVRAAALGGLRVAVGGEPATALPRAPAEADR